MTSLVSDSPLTLVTGASSGIGREIAQRLSQTRDVILHGRNRQRLQETASLCAPGNHVFWEYDLNEVEGIRNSLTALCNLTGRPIHEFVHSAGIPSVGAVRLMTVSQILRTLNINTVSALEISACLLRKSINEAKIERIVFISSIWGQYGSAGHALYSASKGALDAAMKSMAVELAPKVRVNSLSLGAIRTQMSTAALLNPDIRAHAELNYPLGIGTTSDAAATCEFMLSDKARWMTGQVLVLDGGRTAHMSNQ